MQDHPGIHKVTHESKVGMPFKEVMFTRTTAAVQRCMDAGAGSSDSRYLERRPGPNLVRGCPSCRRPR